MDETGKKLTDTEEMFEKFEEPGKYADMVEVTIRENLRTEGVSIQGGKWAEPEVMLGSDYQVHTYRVVDNEKDMITEYSYMKRPNEKIEGRVNINVGTYRLHPSSEPNALPHREELFFDNKTKEWVPKVLRWDEKKKSMEPMKPMLSVPRNTYEGTVNENGLHIWSVESPKVETPKKAPKLLDRLFKRATVGK